MMCKFTPLGFETRDIALTAGNEPGVNLPRWGLKHSMREAALFLRDGVNLPRWGLKLFLS